MTDLASVVAFPATCYGTAVREGVEDVCRRPAVAARCDPEDEGKAWPCCVSHARVGRMVPLSEILSAGVR